MKKITIQLITDEPHTKESPIGKYTEVLKCTKDSVDLSKFGADQPFVKELPDGSKKSVGTVKKVWVDEDKGAVMATVEVEDDFDTTHLEPSVSWQFRAEDLEVAHPITITTFKRWELLDISINAPRRRRGQG